MLNPNIPLSVNNDSTRQLNNLANTFNGLRQERQQAPIREQQNKLLNLQTQGQQQQNDQQRKEFQAKRAITDAVPVREALETNPEAALGLIDQRIATITAEGGDPSDTVAFKKKLLTNPQAAIAELDGIISTGRQIGVLSTPAAPKLTKEEQLLNARDRAVAAGDNERAAVLNDAIQKSTTRDTSIQDSIALLTLDQKRFRLEEDKRNSAQEIRQQEQAETAQATQRESARAEAQDIVKLAREVSSDVNGIDAISGISGNFETRLPSTKSFEAKLDKLVNVLSLDNTDKLKGAISEGELRLLANSISAVRAGGSIDENRKELEGIVSRLEQELARNFPEASPGGGSGQTFQSSSGVSFTVEQ